MSAKQYRKKPVVIQAIQFTGDNAKEIFEWIESFDPTLPAGVSTRKELVIETLEGSMIAPPGWFIIRGVIGEFYPCDPDVFAQTYEEVT